MPATNRIYMTYANLIEAEKGKRATDMVKITIIRGILESYGGDEKEIRTRINRYLKEGQVMHLVLEGSRSINPGLLLLFAGQEESMLLLSIDTLELDARDGEMLRKPITLNE